MIWYIGLLICIIISLFLTRRSMRDFKENPLFAKDTSYGFFLIHNTQNLTAEIFTSLMNSLKGLIVSFEFLQKGDNRVLIGYLPHHIQSLFPGLRLIEIEDYITGNDTSQTEEYILARQININDSFAISLQSKKKYSPELRKKNLIKFPLRENQYAAIQIVAQPAEQGIQITPRALIKEANSQEKIALIKKIRQYLIQQTSLADTTGPSHGEVFEDYKKRTLVPRHAKSYVITEKELYEFLKD